MTPWPSMSAVPSGRASRRFCHEIENCSGGVTSSPTLIDPLPTVAPLISQMMAQGVQTSAFRRVPSWPGREETARPRVLGRRVLRMILLRLGVGLHLGRLLDPLVVARDYSDRADRR